MSPIYLLIRLSYYIRLGYSKKVFVSRGDRSVVLPIVTHLLYSIDQTAHPKLTELACNMPTLGIDYVAWEG